MKTEVVMKRELFGKDISQKSKSGFFSATELVKAGDLWRLQNDLGYFNMNKWLSKKSTKEFICELEKEYGKVIITGNGRGNHTWVHPFVFIDLALAINPKLKIEVYKWIYDELLKYRNSSGDGYKKMCGYLFSNANNKSCFHREVGNYASQIKEACRVGDWNRATENQLMLRDKIHNNVSLLCDVLKRNDDAVRIGIKKALEN